MPSKTYTIAERPPGSNKAFETYRRFAPHDSPQAVIFH